MDEPTEEVVVVTEASAEEVVEETTGSVPEEVPGWRPQGRYYINKWHQYDNFGCPYCSFTTLNGDLVVQQHVDDKHPEAWLEV